MKLTRSADDTVLERIQRDPAFAKGLQDEAEQLAQRGEPETAQVLYDLVRQAQVLNVRSTPSRG